MRKLKVFIENSKNFWSMELMSKVIVIRWKTTGNIVKGLEDQNKEFSLFHRMRIFNPFSTPTKLERCDTFPFLRAHGTVCESPLGCNEGE